MGPRPTAHSPRPTARGPRPMAYGLWHHPWPMAYGLWPIAYGLFHRDELEPVAYGVQVSGSLKPLPLAKPCLLRTNDTNYVSFRLEPLWAARTLEPNWKMVLSTGRLGSVDVGAARFNAMFHASPSHSIMRKCLDCAPSHKTIIYKRLTNTSSFMPYDYMKLNWFSANNKLNTDFDLFSNWSDAIANTSRWVFCNYDDSGAGFPRDYIVMAYSNGLYSYGL